MPNDHVPPVGWFTVQAHKRCLRIWPQMAVSCKAAMCSQLISKRHGGIFRSLLTNIARTDDRPNCSGTLMSRSLTSPTGECSSSQQGHPMVHRMTSMPLNGANGDLVRSSRTASDTCAKLEGHDDPGVLAEEGHTGQPIGATDIKLDPCLRAAGIMHRDSARRRVMRQRQSRVYEH